MAMRAKIRAFLAPAVVIITAAVNGCTVIVGLQLVPPEHLDGDAGSTSSGPLSSGESSGLAVTGSTTPAQGAGADAGLDSDDDASMTAAHGGDSATASPESSVPTDYGQGAFQVLAGAGLKLKGMTSDDWIVYLDTSGTYFEYKAVSIPTVGGAPSIKNIYQVPEEASADAMVIGRLAFTWGDGILTLWSSSLDAPMEISETSIQDAVWVSADSGHFIYLDSVAGAFVGVNGDGTQPTTLVASSNETGECVPRVQFQDDFALVSSCPGGGTNAVLSAFDVAHDWSPALSTPESVVSLLVDPQATMVAVPAPTDAGAFIQVFPIDGGSGTVLDPNHPFFLGQNTAGSYTYPWFVLYNDEAGDLWRAFAAGSPPPQMLVDGGVNSFEAISPQGDLMVVANQLDSAGDPLDLSLVSTTEAGPAQPMATDDGELQSILQSGSGFTENEAFAVFYSDVQIAVLGADQKVTVGQYNAMQTSSPYRAFPAIATNVFDDVSLSGNDVLLLENTTFQAASDGGGNVVVDVEVVDLSSNDGGIASATIVQGIPREVALTSDQTRIAYVAPFGSTPGIYIAPIPSP